MDKLVIKTDHSHINETAEYYFQKGSAATADLDENKITLGYWRRKIFYALMREVILASGIDSNITSANEKAKYIVDGYGYYSRLLVFMNSFITSETFRVSLCQRLRYFDIGEVYCGALKYDDSANKLHKVIDELVLSCGKGVGSSAYVLGNSYTKELFSVSPKKAELSLILNSLTPFMIEVYKLKLHTCSKSFLTKHINDLLKDFNLERIDGKLNKTCSNINDAVRYDRYTEDILITMVAVKNVVSSGYNKFKGNREKSYNVKEILNDMLEYINFVPCEYDKFKENFKDNKEKSYNVKEILNDMMGYINYVTTNSAIYDIGLESLINY